MIEIEPEGVDTCDEDVHSNVKLEAVNEEGVLDVPLNTEGALLGVFRLRNITEVTQQLYTKPTGTLKEREGI